MSRAQRLSRRHFLKTSLAGAAVGTGMLWGGVPDRMVRLARAAARRRRHLIYCVAGGGWDSYLSHQSVLSADAAGLSIDTIDTLREKADLTRRFTDDQLVRVNDTRGGARYMGPIWSDTKLQEVSSEILVWRGMQKEAEHIDGNTLMHLGAITAYAASSASLVANDLASDYLRPLHYVQVAPSPGDLWMTSGLLTSSAAIPTNIPDMQTWRDLTGTGEAAIAANFRRSFISESLGKLGALSAGLSVPGATVYRSFAQSTADTGSIRGTNYANSPEFNEILTLFRGARDEGVASATAAKRYAIMSEGNGRGAISSDFEQIVFAYALAFFLVKKDLSAVVVIPTPTGDHHDYDDTQYMNQIVTFSLFRRLIQLLKATQDPGTPGQDLLECTTLVLDTEMDRTYNCSYLNSASSQKRPGTAHGNSSSVIMAGKGVQGGRVIGDIYTGPRGPYASAFGQTPFSYPLPIDFTTGIPDANGAFTHQRSLLPTVLAIFGIPVPPEQNTGFKVVSAVLNC